MTYRTITIGSGDEPTPVDLPTSDLLTLTPIGWYWPQGGARITVRPDGSAILNFGIGGFFDGEV